MPSYDAMPGTERDRFALSLQKAKSTEFGATRHSSLKERLDKRALKRNPEAEKPGAVYFSFVPDQMEVLLRELQRETTLMAAEDEHLLAVGRQTYQAMVDNRLEQADVKEAAEHGTFSQKLTQFLESLGFKPDFKLRLPMRWACVALVLMLLLVACGGGVTVEANTPMPPTVVASETVPVTEEIEETATPEGFGEKTTVDYGRYAGEEQQADMIVIPKWQEIVDELNRLNLALPTNLEIVDVAADNILVEALQTGRADDYPEGTTFTLSQVTGHEGELLTVTVDGANEVLSGSPAVGLAISIDNLPAAIDAQGNVVAYVDPQTGQWTAGSRGLAPEVVANVPQTTATADTENPYFNLPADSVELNASEEEITQKLAELGQYGFPLGYNEALSTYSRLCLVEKLNFLKEGSYIRIGDFDVRVTGECSYLDVNREKQTALVALAVQNSVEGGTWMPNFVAPGVFAPSVIQESFETSTKIKPGMILDIAFNLPDANNLSLKGAAHHGRAVEQLYTQEEIKKFVRTKNPNSLNNKIIMPLSIARIWIFEE